MSARKSTEPWYRDGLAFECTRCGACCTGAPGYVWVDDEEIAALAHHLALSVDDFTRKYVRRVEDDLSLIEKPGGDCIFWTSDAGCTVYPARPRQCRTWPFWPENVRSERAWKRVCEICPGSGTGPVYTVEAIQIALEMVRK